MNAVLIILLAIFCALGGYSIGYFGFWKLLDNEKEKSYREGFFDGQQVPDKDFLDEYYEEGYKDGYVKAGGKLIDLEKKSKAEILLDELDDLFEIKEQPKGKNYDRYCEKNKNKTILFDAGEY